MTPSSSWSRLRKSTTLSKSKNLWPEPELSIGTWYRKMGILECWEATGHAQLTFALLSEEIKGLLEKRSDYISRGEPILHSITFGIYMTGRKKENAQPTIIFSCKKAGPRKRAKEIIKESEILDAHPGVKLGDTTYPPDFDQAPMLLATDDMVIDTTGGDDVKKTVLCHSYGDLCGKPIFIRGCNGDNAILRKATAGGVFVSQGRYFCQTVAHAFTEPIEYVEEIDTSEFEFDIDGEHSDIDDESNEIAETTSLGSLTDSDEVKVMIESHSDVSSHGRNSSIDSRSSEARAASHSATRATNSPGLHEFVQVVENSRPAVLEYLRNFDRPSHQNTNRPMRDWSYSLGRADTPHIVLGDLSMSSINQPYASLDWALIEIKDPNLWTFNKFPLTTDAKIKFIYPERIRNPGPVNIPILSVTGSSGLLSGTLLGSPSYMKSPGGQAFQEVWTIRLSGKLSNGDCGSWVIDAKTGDLYGHIVSGSSSGVAYMIPVSQVFKEIEQCLRGNVEFPLDYRPIELGKTWADEHTTYTMDSYVGFPSPMYKFNVLNLAQSPSGPHGPPFEQTRLFHSLTERRGSLIIPIIQARLDKGFFKEDQDWTCYRRNYFSVICSYSLTPEAEPFNREIYLRRFDNLNPERIKTLGVCVAATIGGDEGKPIELVQHTPKRDKGPMSTPQIQEVSPTLDPPVPGQLRLSVATFDRIQFKRATANNGKRRAAQQYFRVLVDLYAKVPQGESESQWVRIASQLSAPIVVRGRSPGHYQDNRPNIIKYHFNTEDWMLGGPSLTPGLSSSLTLGGPASIASGASGRSSDSVGSYDPSEGVGSHDPSERSSISSLENNDPDSGPNALEAKAQGLP